MEQTKVSVVIPVYNVEPYLHECLDSLIGQSMQEIEIICVDDGSTDKSVEIIEAYIKRDSRVKLIRQQNQYAGVARNNGLAVATGEYVIFLDSDDFFARNLLEETYSQGKKEDADIVLFGGKSFDTQTHTYSERPYYFRRDYLPSENVFSRKNIPDKILTIVTPCPWTKLFKREFVIKNQLKFQSLQNSNDAYFVLTALALANRITYVDADLVYYRVGQSTNLQSNKSKNPTLFLQAYEAVYKAFVERGIYKEIEKSFIEVVLSGCIYNIDTVHSEASREKIYRAIMESTFVKDGILEHPSDFYADEKKIMRIRGLRYMLDWKDKLNNSEADQEFQVIIDRRNLQKQVAVSVVIPVYNVSDYIEACIKSIRNQTLNEIEIICVNDGSTDDSCEKLLKFADEDERIVVCTQRNSGQSVARNMGVQQSRGEYLYFMDSDDILDDEALEILYKQSKGENLDVLYFDGTCFSDSDECKEQLEANKKYYLRKQSYKGIYRGEELMCTMMNHGEYRVSPCLQLIKRQHFIEHDLWFYKGIVHEDNLFNYKCMLKATRVSHIQKALFNRRYRPSSTMTVKVSFAHVYGYFRCYLEMYDFYRENTFHVDCEEEILEVLYRVLYNVRKGYSNLEDDEKYAIKALPLLEQKLFKWYVSDFCDLNQKLNMNNARDRKNGTLKNYYGNSVERLQKRLYDVENSTTYKVGKFIMKVPCTLKDWCIKIKDKG